MQEKEREKTSKIKNEIEKGGKEERKKKGRKENKRVSKERKNEEG